MDRSSKVNSCSFKNLEISSLFFFLSKIEFQMQGHIFYHWETTNIISWCNLSLDDFFDDATLGLHFCCCFSFV